MNDLTPVFVVLFLIACMAVVAAGYALLDWHIKRIVARDKKEWENSPYMMRKRQKHE
jgi:hypothetical protein